MVASKGGLCRAAVLTYCPPCCAAVLTYCPPCCAFNCCRADAVLGKPASWEWINESKSQRPKWGYVSRTPGAVLKIRVNTTASTGDPKHPVLVQLGYLKSYEHMGKAIIR